MDRFLRFDNLISKTHEFFEDSFIYYNDRANLMTLLNNVIINNDNNNKVCWQGQLGGFEGLRQKGWSVLNYLVLRREALTRNTQTSPR